MLALSGCGFWEREEEDGRTKHEIEGFQRGCLPSMSSLCSVESTSFYRRWITQFYQATLSHFPSLSSIPSYLVKLSQPEHAGMKLFGVPRPSRSWTSPCDSVPTNVDLDLKPDPELGSYFDDLTSAPESRSYFDDPDLDPNYDDDEPDSDDDLDPNPNYDDDDPDSDDDPNPEFVYNLDPDPDLDLDFGPYLCSDIDPRIPIKPVLSSAAQITTSRLMTPTHKRDCAYYGDPRHTRKTCFKLHGYPEWWATLKDRTQRNRTSNGTSYGFHTSDKIDFRNWIIDSSAIDHVTFDPDDFLNTTQPRRTCIANANGVTYSVTGADTDTHTKEILGRGTKRERLYYVVDFSPGMANSVTHSFDSKQKQIWLWHSRLGHPFFSYMKHPIQDLFSGFKDSDFTCDTCILAKSRSVPYQLSTNMYTTSFTLIHFDVWGPSPITAPSGVR
ncbi:hypothetical protein L3X38_005902 [Prunus dulcis]|uniref:GAG-pre-integrase domain-containing protein n=1 Tax=Prunus dulcis TaxID=3755 RepID=A0AAD4ZRT5_PRUDU|nr:hypothetical protein L3X38_005902 [Prunus dulcis]